MPQAVATSRFKAKLLRPATLGRGESWAFLVLPKAISDTLPRRGRTTIEGTINGHSFQATLEPDGKLSHWLKGDVNVAAAAGAAVGNTVALEISPVTDEPEPIIPPDLNDALAASSEAKRVWDATTTIARLDWIHWIESAKQAKTRGSRVKGACDMLAAGKKRVCCFDQSGYYSKSLSAPAESSER